MLEDKIRCTCCGDEIDPQQRLIFQYDRYQFLCFECFTWTVMSEFEHHKANNYVCKKVNDLTGADDEQTTFMPEVYTEYWY